jgi:hypothetical protein
MRPLKAAQQTLMGFSLEKYTGGIDNEMPKMPV